MTIPLDASSVPPKGVFSASKLSMYVGNPPRELLIFTGVAEPEWDSKGNLDRETVVVTLPGTTTPFFQSAASVGLASITNTDSDFTFAADDTSVVVGPTGQLELHIDIAVQGDTSLLSRINYHVEVLSDPIVAKISGTIRWNEQWGQPTSAALAQAISMFSVVAGLFVSDPGAGLGSSHWESRATTQTTAVPVRANGFWAVPYVLENVPLGQQFTVVPSLNPASFVGNNGTPVYSPSPRTVTLTPAMPTITGVDFEMSFQGGVR
jgi:hypothetical protein